MPLSLWQEKTRALIGTALWTGGVVLGLGTLALEYGFTRRTETSAVICCLAVSAAALLWAGKLAGWLWVRRDFHWTQAILDGFLLLGLAAALILVPLIAPAGLSGGRLRWACFHLYLLTICLLQVGRFTVRAAAAGRTPTQVLLISFALIICTGAILLMLPAAYRGQDLSFTDAVFTATSATCVTGLTVQDTGGAFTRLGQMIILALIQVGGLGIMIYGSLFALLLGSRLTLKETVAMRDIMNEQSPGRVGRMVVFICLLTFLVEAIGVAGLYGMWQTDSQRGGQIFKSVFHAVSAFCNAGFSLQADSLESYRFAVPVYLVIVPLIILGGLGFPVLENLWHLLLARRRRRRSPAGSGAAVPTAVRLSLHSKVVLATSLILLLSGWIGLWVLDLTRPDQKGAGFNVMAIVDGWFNSVTARTAGFNTVSIAERSAAGKLVLIFLMSVGGSPSSTAGGIKTVTLAVMVLAMYATIKRRRQVQVFHRTIPVMVVRRAATMILLYGLLLWLLTLLLTITEHSLGADLMDLLFEVASALGTVGLSTGVTGHLTLAGKWVIIGAMFVGRLGPLSLLAALTFNARPVRYEYPAEPLVVG
ncbi:MAG: hypothetical protein JW810_09355 [Sedimentisphaerales bacterium]|nr:hypothetical protein [Sedimentisphaerales bacterium]